MKYDFKNINLHPSKNKTFFGLFSCFGDTYLSVQYVMVRLIYMQYYSQKDLALFTKF